MSDWETGERGERKRPEYEGRGREGLGWAGLAEQCARSANCCRPAALAARPLVRWALRPSRVPRVCCRWLPGFIQLNASINTARYCTSRGL